MTCEWSPVRRGWGQCLLRMIWILPVVLLIPACSGSKNSNSAPPAFAGLVSATKGAPGSQEIILAWTPAVDFSGTGITYQVEYCIGSLPAQSGQETPQTSTTNGTGITLTGLFSGDPYVFHVVAVDGTGQGDGNGVEIGQSAP